MNYCINTLRLLTIATITLSAINCFAVEISAPFGFSWGAQKRELSAMGISDCKPIDSYELCSASSAPKPVSFAESYLLVFDSNQGLQKITAVGKATQGDIIGAEGKKIYNELKLSLTEKYGKSQSFEYVGRALYKEYDEFYQCLKYDGCGKWISFWGTEAEGGIALELNGIRRGVGFIRLSYESKAWAGILNAAKKAKGKIDKDAL